VETSYAHERTPGKMQNFEPPPPPPLFKGRGTWSVILRENLPEPEKRILRGISRFKGDGTGRDGTEIMQREATRFVPLHYKILG